MLQFVQSETGNLNAVREGTTLVQIERTSDGKFKLVSDDPEFIGNGGMFGTLASAQTAVLDFLGETLAPAPAKGSSTSAPRSKGKGSSKNASTSPAKGSSKRTEKKASPVQDAKVRNVSPVMQRNISELAAGNYPVYITAEQFAQLARSKNYRELARAGIVYKNGTGNIYPTPAQAKNLARMFAGTDAEPQCKLGGYTAWRNSLRKRASAPAKETSESEVAA